LKLRQIAGGVATGYFTKAIQFVTTMLLVPFLLRPDVLGVEEYGRAFTLIAFMGVCSFVTAGIRLSFLRSISQGIGEQIAGRDSDVGSLIGSGTAILTVICGALAFVGTAFEEPILSAVRFPSDPSYGTAWHLAMLWMFAENGLFLFRGPLMTRGAISYVNWVSATEVIARAGVLVWLLPGSDAPIVTYFVVNSVAALLRCAAFIGWSLGFEPSDLRGIHVTRLSKVREIVAYSGSITVAEGASFAVRRAPVLLASRYLGATEAGFVAIVVNTIQDYVLQVLFTVIQPLAVPIAARFDPRRISQSARAFFYDLEALYCGSVILVISGGIVLAPDLIRLWLGPDFQSIVLPAQVILAGCGIEITYSIRKSLLIGQGLFADAVWRIGGLAVATAALTVAAIVVARDWVLAVFVIGGYMVASNVVGIGVVWSRHFERGEHETPGSRRFVAFAPSFALAAFGSSFVTEGSWLVDATVAVAVLVSALGCVTWLVIPIGQARSTIARLLRSMDRDLFGA